MLRELKPFLFRAQIAELLAGERKSLLTGSCRLLRFLLGRADIHQVLFQLLLRDKQPVGGRIGVRKTD